MTVGLSAYLASFAVATATGTHPTLAMAVSAPIGLLAMALHQLDPDNIL